MLLLKVIRLPNAVFNSVGSIRATEHRPGSECRASGGKVVERHADEPQEWMNNFQDVCWGIQSLMRR